MTGANNPIEPQAVEPQRRSMDSLVWEVREAVMRQKESHPDLTGAETYLSPADWRELNERRAELGQDLFTKAKELQGMPLLPTDPATSEDTPAMSMPQEETPVHLQHPMRIDVYHSTYEPFVLSMTPSGVAGQLPSPDDGWRAAVAAYHRALEEKGIGGRRGFRFLRPLGQGGQGKVFLCRCPGADGFSRIVALKLFSPEAYPTLASYQQAMRRIARVVTRVSAVSHDHVVDVQRFLKRDEIRIMLMERIEGFDLRRLLQPKMLQRFRDRASDEDWRKTNQIVVTAGPEQARLLPGAAVTIVRDCLAGLRTLHCMGIIHGDIRPANLMVQPDGSIKIIDLGSVVVQGDAPRERVFTPAYAAPEVLESKPWLPQSDLASLGYVLLELLTGRHLFAPSQSIEQLLEAKRALPDRVPQLLPAPLHRSGRLVAFCQRLIAPDPQHRFSSAEQADVDPEYGAYAFHQELARGKLDAVWKHDVSIWQKYLRPAKRSSRTASRCAKATS